jgi:selenocysteine-specific elongation factor
VVDVPGHKDLVRNVIAGVWGIDAVLLVVAADDGWMLQTEEHLQILNLLRIKHGIVVINKIDLVDGSDWINLVEEDIKSKLKGTGLEDAPIIRVSARDGTNIDLLQKKIGELISGLSPRRDIGKPRLPIDRVFTIKGSGTVVTGTLIDGSLSQGQSVVIYPKNLQTRIRGLETYKEKVESTKPSTRLAINLVGLEKASLKRGDIIFGSESQVKAGKTIDVSVELIPDLTVSLKTNTEIKVYLGTREIIGKILLMEGSVLRPGESALAQFRFQEPVAACIGDHFIIRKPSPTVTIGGGAVLDPLAIKHKIKEMDKAAITLRRRLNLELDELILTEIEKYKYIKLDELLVASQYSSSEINDHVKQLIGKHRLVISGQWVIDHDYWQQQTGNALAILTKEHKLNPLQKGVLQAELQNRFTFPRDIFNGLITSLIDSKQVVREKDIIYLYSHNPNLQPEQEVIAARILKLFEKDRTNPPTRKEITALHPGSDSIIRFMCAQNTLVELSDGVLFEYDHFQSIKEKVIDFLKTNGTISIQNVRELTGLTRKYILPILIKLDDEGTTKRRGDERILG